MTMPGLPGLWGWDPAFGFDESESSEQSSPPADRDGIAGFSVVAQDGEIGKVDDATYEAGSSMLIVDTGPWIFGRKVMLPAGVVGAIDWENEQVMVERTKQEIKGSPEYDETDSAAYRDQLSAYYGEGGAGWRP